MKNYFESKVTVAGGAPAFWLFAAAFLLFAVLFVIRQTEFAPLDAQTATDFVIDESKGRASSFKKYFPKPYSARVLAKERE